MWHFNEQLPYMANCSQGLQCCSVKMPACAVTSLCYRTREHFDTGGQTFNQMGLSLPQKEVRGVDYI